MPENSGDTIPVSPDTKKKLEPLKKSAENTPTWNEFIVELTEGTLDVSLDEIEVEQTEERIERTRATIVAILETVDELGLTEDVLDIVKTLSQQDMLAKNQEIIEHLLEKSKNNEPLNEVDHLLARIVVETEQEREIEQSPAAEIAQGLFAETDTATAERTTTERQRGTKSASISENRSADHQIEENIDFEDVDVSTEITNEEI